MEEATPAQPHRSRPHSQHQAQSRWWTEIVRALDELAEHHPETAPAVLDERIEMVHLASGERIALQTLLSDLVDCPPECARGLILDHLATARAAAASVSLLTVGSWSAMAPLLGLVLRQRATGAIGRPIGPALALIPVIGTDHGLIPVTRDLLQRWDQAAPIVIETATANITSLPVNLQPVDLRPWLGPDSSDNPRLLPPTAWVAVGGPFTTGRLATLESIDEGFRSTETLVTGLGDHALLLVPIDRRMASRSRFELAQALQNLAIDLRGRMSIRPEDHTDAILLCRSDGQVAIFRIRG